MSGNKNLNSAAKNKNDEFYTQFDDIQREINCYIEYDQNIFRDKTILLPCDDPTYSNFTKFFAMNFDYFGLKKLISTSYAPNSKKFIYQPMANLFDEESPIFDASKENSHGKIYILDREIFKAKPYEVKLDSYLDGDGDFRSKEVSKLRDESDIIITNPPFSLFREFLKWIMQANKKFLIIGNINCITYKEVFPLIKENKIWLGNGMGRWISGFIVPDGYELYGTEARINQDGERIVATNQCLWLTNLEHGRRHKPMSLNTMALNIKHCKHKDVKGSPILYAKYDNYDAIEVPYTDLIPEDYEGVMGVPISFLNRYCPEQFELLGCSYIYGDCGYHKAGTDWNCYIDGKRIFKRIFIRKRR